MLCPQRHRLVGEYQTAVKAFKNCVLALNDLHGFEFGEAYEISEERRVQSKGKESRGASPARASMLVTPRY